MSTTAGEVNLQIAGERWMDGGRRKNAKDGESTHTKSPVIN